MATIRRYVVTWSGLSGLPGVSVFYSASGVDVSTDLATFFNAIKSGIPAPCSWSIPGSGDTLDSDTGHLNGAWTGGTPATVTSSSSAAYAAGTGMYIRWVTGGLRNSRKFQGRTFICPIGAGLYETDGSISGSYLTTVQNAADALVAGGPCLIWGRPSGPGATDGIVNPVVGAVLPDKVTSLKTRRR